MTRITDLRKTKKVFVEILLDILEKGKTRINTDFTENDFNTAKSLIESLFPYMETDSQSVSILDDKSFDIISAMIDRLMFIGKLRDITVSEDKTSVVISFDYGNVLCTIYEGELTIDIIDQSWGFYVVTSYMIKETVVGVQKHIRRSDNSWGSVTMSKIGAGPKNWGDPI